MSRVFISYRRDDTGWPAQALKERLTREFGAECVFMDIDNIQPGDKFDNVIEQNVGCCDVLIAFIGTIWISITDSSGTRRLEDPNDFVRLEVATALKRDILVIPVLVDGAAMPRADELPLDLRALSRRQAVDYNSKTIDAATGRLLSALKKAFDSRVDSQSTAAPGADSSAESSWHPSTTAANSTDHVRDERADQRRDPEPASTETPQSDQEKRDRSETPLGGDVRLALLGAATAMKRTNWPIITTVHLWIGLSYITSGLLSSAMRRRGIDPAEARRAMRKAIHREKCSSESDDSILSENAESAIAAARELAKQAGSEKVVERHLLQAILAQRDSGATLILENIGIDRNQLLDDNHAFGESAVRSSLHGAADSLGHSVSSGDVLCADGSLDLSKFDEDCRAALAASCRASQEMNQDEIRTPQLFLGVLERENSRASARLRQHGIDVSDLCKGFRMLLPTSSQDGCVGAQLHRDFLSKNALGALRDACRNAALQGRPMVSEAELISALLSGGSIVARALENHGVDHRLFV